MTLHMSWRRISRLIIVGVTLLTIGFALVAGHVSGVSHHGTGTGTSPAPSFRVRCIRVTAPTGTHRSAIKCP